MLFGVLQLLTGGVTLCLDARKGIVQTGDVTVEVCTERDRVAHLVGQGDPVLPGDAVKPHHHPKAPIRSQRDRVGAGHGLTGFQDGGTRRLFGGVALVLDNHGGEAIRIRAGIFRKMGHVGLIAGDALFVLTDFLGQIFGDFIFQGILLTEEVGLE